MSIYTLVSRYALFATVATISNLAIQRLIFWLHDGAGSFVTALLFGTAIGLFVKYLLDKRWIFKDMSDGPIAQAKKFWLYSLTGVITTAIFWGVETVFWLIWKTNTMRELGAIIGLSIGYIVKYRLDKKYVFHVSKPEVIA